MERELELAELDVLAEVDQARRLGLTGEWCRCHRPEVALDIRSERGVEAERAQLPFDQLLGFDRIEFLEVGVLQNRVKQQSSSHAAGQVREKRGLSFGRLRWRPWPGRLLVVPGEAREARNACGVAEVTLLLPCSERPARSLVLARRGLFIVRRTPAGCAR
jgi:hypothetical protein